MAEKSNYFVLRAKAVPEVLLKVVEAKRLLDSGKLESVQEATDAVGISRSSFYKYKDDIFPFYEGRKGKTVNLVIQMDDEQGILSVVLKSIADAKANILTIHQSVPVNGIASLTLSVDVFPESDDVDDMAKQIESLKGIQYVKILARESQKDEDCSIGLWYRRFWCGRGSGCKSEADRVTGKRRN